MSNKIIQSCNVCGADNTDNDKTWVRSFGVFPGAPMPSLQTPPQGQTLAPNMAWPVLIDLCSKCSAKTTITQLTQLTTQPAMKIISSAPTLVATTTSTPQTISK